MEKNQIGIPIWSFPIGVMDVFRIGPWQYKLDIQNQPYEVAYTTINLIKIRCLLDFFQFCYLSTQQISIILISDLNISIGSGFCCLFYDVFFYLFEKGFSKFSTFTMNTSWAKKSTKKKDECESLSY
jgi:hypothetical protein